MKAFMPKGFGIIKKTPEVQGRGGEKEHWTRGLDTKVLLDVALCDISQDPSLLQTSSSVCTLGTSAQVASKALAHSDSLLTLLAFTVWDTGPAQAVLRTDRDSW